jgi:hypothetical protein
MLCCYRAVPAGTHTVTAANGHVHSRGRRFRIWGWDDVSTMQPGDPSLFYDNTNWSEPEMKTDIGVVLPQNRWYLVDVQLPVDRTGRRLRRGRPARCQHANDCCYTFGPMVESSEHCNVFSDDYPKLTAENVPCF